MLILYIHSSIKSLSKALSKPQATAIEIHPPHRTLAADTLKDEPQRKAPIPASKPELQTPNISSQDYSPSYIVSSNLSS